MRADSARAERRERVRHGSRRRSRSPMGPRAARSPSADAARAGSDATSRWRAQVPATASAQPAFPQLHMGPSRSTVMCPPRIPAWSCAPRSTWPADDRRRADARSQGDEHRVGRAGGRPVGRSRPRARRERRSRRPRRPRRTRRSPTRGGRDPAGRGTCRGPRRGSRAPGRPRRGPRFRRRRSQPRPRCSMQLIHGLAHPLQVVFAAQIGERRAREEPRTVEDAQLDLGAAEINAQCRHDAPFDPSAGC